MFVGDARPSHSSDEWVYHDLDILKEVVLPAVRIALKLHQVNLIMHVTTHLHNMCIFINCVYEFCDLASDFTKFGIKPIIVCCILGSRILQFILLPPNIQNLVVKIYYVNDSSIWAIEFMQWKTFLWYHNCFDSIIVFFCAYFLLVKAAAPCLGLLYIQ